MFIYMRVNILATLWLYCMLLRYLFVTSKCFMEMVVLDCNSRNNVCGYIHGYKEMSMVIQVIPVVILVDLILMEYATCKVVIAHPLKIYFLYM